MKIVKRTFLFVLVFVVGIVIYLLIVLPPIATAMVAKTQCSCVYLTGRNPETVRKEELSVFPGLSKVETTFNPADSSVTATLFGRKSKAIFRKGLGCTLLAERTEAEVRLQKFNLPDPTPINYDSLPWPTGEKISDQKTAGVDYGRIKEAIDSAFIDLDPARPVITHGVVVVYDGKLIGEKYAEGFNKDSRLMGWSMTKSIINALIGILVKQGKLNVDDPAPVGVWQQDERKAITLNNLLQASSGLKWSESYFLPGDFHNMFTFSDDKGGYAAGNKLEVPPNTQFKYSSGTSNILSKIVRETVGDREYYKFAYEQLFYKIGMSKAIIEPDASGTYVGSSYGFATARDWARFGLLYQQDGVWSGERILPEGWVKYTSTSASTAPKQEYGAQWWLNLGEKGKPANCFVPGIPADAFMAEGFERQYVLIIPSKKLVIVRLGVTHHGNFDLAKLVNGVISALP